MLNYAKFFNFDKNFGEIDLWGFDEVGRGALAGPIVGCLAHFHHDVYDHFEELCREFPGLRYVNDSKKLKPTMKMTFVQALEGLLKLGLFDFVLTMIGPEIIDSIGIQKANKNLVSRLLCQLDTPPELLVIDRIGGIRDNEVHYGTLKVPYRNEAKADGTYACVATASVVAKTFRDRYMSLIDTCYGYKLNAGYGSEFHRRKILEIGPSEFHRMSFLKKIISDNPS